MATVQEHAPRTLFALEDCPSTPRAEDTEVSPLVVTLSDDVAAFIERVAHEEDLTEADVIRRAFGLLKLAREAFKQGLKVGAAEKEQDLEIVFDGF